MDIYEKACAELNFQPLTNEHFNAFPEEDRLSIFAYHKLTMVHRAKNLNKSTGEKWIIDWLNWAQRKWFGWFRAVKNESKKSGFGFVFGGAFCDYADTGLGSRLVLKEASYVRELAEDPEYLILQEEFIV